MKKIIYILCFLSLFLQAEMITKNISKTSHGVGMGETYEEALNKALSNALAKINGASLNTKINLNTNLNKHNAKNDLQKAYNEQIALKSHGSFDSYEVINSIKTADAYKVEVKIKKSKSKTYYKTPGHSVDGRRKIALASLYSSTPYFNIEGKNYESGMIGDHLNQELINAITQTRKFSVLDRNSNQAYMQEARLIFEQGADLDKLKLNNVASADYLYIVNIADFDINKHENTQILASSEDNFIVHASIQYKIIAFATRQIKFSNTQNFSFKIKGENQTQLILNALKNIAKALSDDIINNIYPPKIAAIKGEEIVIASNLHVGDIYEVFALGEMVQNTYTKENAARVESKIGEAKITRISPKLSYGKMLSGKAKKGYILRLKSSGQNPPSRADVSEEEKPSAVEFMQNGGVKLPFE